MNTIYMWVVYNFFINWYSQVGIGLLRITLLSQVEIKTRVKQRGKNKQEKKEEKEKACSGAWGYEGHEYGMFSMREAFLC